MIDTTSLIMLVSVTLLLGYLGSLFYSKTKIPDLIWLLTFGILLGPVFHLYDPELFLELSSLMSTVALSIILFEAGINMDIKQVVQALPKSMALLGFTFSLSVISIGFFLHIFMPQDFTLIQGLLLGTMVGGTSTVTTLGILSALEKIMDIQSIKVVLTLESVLTDPVCIVTAITLIQMIMFPGVSLTEGIKVMLFSFGVSSMVGLVIGLIWAMILDRLFGRPLNYMITIAVLFLTYILSEEIGGHGSGPIAALLFGLVLTNFSSILEKFGSYTALIEKKELRSFHEEISFFIKSFFFVYVGLIVSISTTHLIVGLIVVGICAAIRFIAASIVSSIMKFTKLERVLSRSIFANGLPALIMSQLPLIYDPAKQYFLKPEIYPNMCFIIVLGTVLYGALLGPYLARKAIKT